MKLEAAQPENQPPSPAAPTESDPDCGKFIAVLFNGPSLPRVWRNEYYSFYDLTLACNTAGWNYTCDWVNSSDRHVIKPLLDGKYPRPKRGLISNRAYGEMAQRKGWGWYLPKIYSRSGPQMPKEMAPPGVSTDGSGYTAINTLYTALEWVGENGSIDIYGMDFSSSPVDYAGVKGQHDAARWRNEGSWFRLIWDDRIRNIYGDITQDWIDYFKS